MNAKKLSAVILAAAALCAGGPTCGAAPSEWWGGHTTALWGDNESGLPWHREDTHIRSVSETFSWTREIDYYPWEGYGPPLPSYIIEVSYYRQWGPASLQRAAFWLTKRAGGQIERIDEWEYAAIGAAPTALKFRGIDYDWTAQDWFELEGDFNYGASTAGPTRYKATVVTMWAAGKWFAAHATTNIFFINAGGYSMAEPKPKPANFYFGYASWSTRQLVQSP